MTDNGNDVALSEVIGFVLVLALIIAAMSLWMVYVVPVNGREDEITRMNHVNEQFTDYKLMLDALRTSRDINSNSPRPVLNTTPVMTSMSFDLGTGDKTQIGGLSLSLFKPVASYATLSINSTGDTFDIDSSSSHAYKTALVDFPLNITSLDYRSNNNYWIQQRYSYQLGGVFLSQDDGATNRISPLISIVNSVNKSVVVNVVPVQIFGNGSIGGNNPVRVDTRQRMLPNYNISSSQYLDNTWVNLSVSTADNATAAMWLTLFKDIAVREQLVSSAYTAGSVWVPVSKRTTVFIYINGSNPDPQLRRVSLYVRRADFDVTLNGIASQLT